MTLNNGLGDAVRQQKGILMDSLLTEHMTAVYGDNCNIWLVLASRAEKTTFKVYNIDGSGISPSPIISPRLGTVSTDFQYIVGTIDISPDRNKLAIASDMLVLYDFDPSSGTIQNPLILDNGRFAWGYSFYYGVCFSPDISKLYGSTSWGYEQSPLFQFDLTLKGDTAIVASKTIVGNANSPAMKRGPDGKIYVASYERPYVDVINQPNLRGSACQYVAAGFLLLPGTESRLGLTNAAGLIARKKNHHTRTDTLPCRGKVLLEATDQEGVDYVWEDGSRGASRQVAAPGVYWLRYQSEHLLGCPLDEHVDSFNVIAFPHTTTRTTIAFSGLCATDTILLHPGNLKAEHYLWENDSKDLYRKVNRTGNYWINYQIDTLCEHYTDFFVVTYPEKEYEVSFIADTLICHRDTIQFSNTSDPHYNEFVWSLGQHDTSTLKNPSYVFEQPGSFSVILSGTINGICPDTVVTTIVVDPRFSSSFTMYPESVCVGESIRFLHRLQGPTVRELNWYFGGRYTTNITDREFIHSFDQGGEHAVMLHAKFRACPESSFTDTIFIVEPPKVDLGTDHALCAGSAPIVVSNRHALRNSAYLWSTGDTTEWLKVLHPGIYSLTVTSELLGCSSTEVIEVKKDCYTDLPNAFTPNGDGINDYFFPRQYLTSSVVTFKLLVYNRWGQIIYEASGLEGRGWDGRFNDKEQPQGVYVYQVEILMNNGGKEIYAGNVTLIR